jgi:diguanylate cyclase
MFRRKTDSGQYDELTHQQMIELVEKHREQSDYMRSCVRVLCYLIKDFTFDLTEIDADDFKKRIDDLVNDLNAADSPKSLQRTFGSGKESIIDFIAREKRYLSDRESEFKGIIDFLRQTIKTFVGESEAFNSQLYEQNLRMGKLNQLDDIRRLKESLQAEVASMRTSIQDKQSSDSRHLEKLVREVEVLRSSLQEYKGAATTDALTQAANRLAFDTFLRSCVEQAEIHHKRLSLLICDIDDFRTFNTRFGHQIGDIVLQLFVTKCRSILRDTDMVARYGGDEFAIVLPNTNLQQAQRIANRICSEVAGARYAHETKSGRLEFGFTTSIGLSEIHRYDTVISMIERADKSLYASKNAGKGCTRTEKDLPKDALTRVAA